VQAGLEFAWNLKDREFIGRAAIERFLADSVQPKRVGLLSHFAPRSATRLFDLSRNVSWHGNQRHVLANAGAADCDGLCLSGKCSSCNGVVG